MCQNNIWDVVERYSVSSFLAHKNETSQRKFWLSLLFLSLMDTLFFCFYEWKRKYFGYLLNLKFIPHADDICIFSYFSICYYLYIFIIFQGSTPGSSCCRSQIAVYYLYLLWAREYSPLASMLFRTGIDPLHLFQTFQTLYFLFPPLIHSLHWGEQLPLHYKNSLHLDYLAERKVYPSFLYYYLALLLGSAIFIYLPIIGSR